MYVSDLKHPAASLEDKLRQLYTLNRDHKIDLGFRTPYLQLLQQFGNPHLKLPPVIHVAGTNGKGSTCAYLRAILEATGASTHAFISPHLVRYNERIVLAGREIGDDRFLDVIDRVDKAAGEDDLTFFETITTAAFLAFAEAHFVPVALALDVDFERRLGEREE